MSDRPTMLTSRRQVLECAAVLGIGVPLLAACGPDEDEHAPPESGTELTTTGDVPVGGGVIVDDVVVTQPTAGEYAAFSAVCTHAKCLVTEVTEEIECPCHGSRFALADGSVLHGPAGDPLARVEIVVEGDRIRTA